VSRIRALHFSLPPSPKNKHVASARTPQTHTQNPNTHNTQTTPNRLAAFALGRYAEAKASLEAGLALRGGEDAATRNYKAWIRKCELEMDEGGAGHVQVSESSATAAASSSSGSSSGSSSAAPASVSVAPAAPAPAPTPTPALPTGAVKYQYYQSGTHVTVTLLQKGLKEEEADVTIEPRRVRARVHVCLRACVWG
jgi:hypothetical protein